MAPGDERTNDSIKAPATQEMKNEHIASLYTRCKLRVWFHDRPNHGSKKYSGHLGAPRFA